MLRTSQGRLAGSIRIALALTALTVAGGVSAKTPDTTVHYDASLLRSSYAQRQASAIRDEVIDPAAVAVYIVQLDEPALAMHDGSVDGLPAPAGRMPDGRLDVSSAAAKQYVQFIGQRQDGFLAAASSKLGRQVTAEARMAHALNALVMKLTPAQAAQLADVAGVKRVDRSYDQPLDTDTGPAFIGANQIWNGTAPGVPAGGTRGAGVVVGIIDSGANFDHPSFAAVGSDGFPIVNPLGAGVYLGTCSGGTPQAACNNKIIGAYDFMTPLVPATDATNGPGGGEDENGHGTHTASTAAGNFVNATFDGIPLAISGVAPHANIVAYDTCYTKISTGQGLCPVAATAQAVNQAVADGIVKVINFSIGGGDEPWSDPTSVAFQAAANAGIVIATSAGNDGPDAATLGHLEPWTMTTASSTHDRLFTDAAVSVTGPTMPAALQDIAGVVGSGPAQTVAVSGPFDVYTTNPTGCNETGGIPNGTFTGIALIERGGCDFVVKVNNATAAGATGVVVYNNRAGAPIVMGALEATTVPSMMIAQADGLAIRAYLEANATATGTFNAVPTERNLVAGAGDLISDFSSRGPSPLNVMKPNMAAPGSNILAALSDGTTTPATAPEYGLLSGTSMASPHNAGAAALLRSLKPGWSVPAIQSALVTSARTAMVKENGTTPADPFDRGGGRIDVAAAANVGLLMNETNANFTAANPANNGDPRTLNLPGIMSDGCVYTCSFVRRFTNTTSGTASWNLTLDLPAGVTGNTVPANITNLAAGATANVTINLDVTNATPDVFAFAQLNMTPTGAAPPSGVPTAQHLPIAVLPSLASLPGTVTIETRRDAGSRLLEDIVTQAAPALTITSSGLVRATRPLVEIGQDPTNTNAYDNLSQVYVTTVTVPPGSTRFIAETASIEAADADLFIGTGSTPSLATEECASTTATATERCEITDPAPGTWWILVQNWQGSAAQPDVIDLWHAAVPGATITGPNTLYGTGPASATAGNEYDVRLFWDDPALVAGDRGYGQIALGSGPGTPGDLGEFPVDLRRLGDDVTKSASPATVPVGGTVNYTITVQPNPLPETLQYTITDAIPAGMTYVPGSATASAGNVQVAGSTLTWTGEQTGTAGGNTTYVWTNSNATANCRTGFAAPNDLYVDLASFGILPQAPVVGDTVRFTAFGTGAPFDFYGVSYPNLGFTDDGFLIFDGANNYAGFPFMPQEVPDPDFPNNLVAGFWKDLELVFQAGTRGVSLGDATSAVVVEYDNVQLFQDPANQYDFEIIMARARSETAGAYEIRVAFDNMTGTQADDATVGVENVGGVIGSAVFNNEPTTIANRTVYCGNATTIVRAPVTITFQAVAQASAAGTTVVNNAVHDTDNIGSEPATASASVAVVGAADVSITKTDNATSVNAGGTLQYVIVASNAAGGATATGTVTDTLPASLACTWTCTGAGGNTCTASGTGNIADPVTLVAGGSVTYTASCTVAGTATGTLTNTATITSVNDSTPANNSAVDTTAVVASNDLSITKTDGLTVVNAGANVSYTIVARNNGASTTTATIADTFGASLEACSWTCAGAGGNTCGASGSGNINNTATLLAGGTVTYTATCTVAATATGTLSNTATITGPNDPTPANNTATDNDTVVRAQADIAVTVTDNTGNVQAQGQTTYTIVASNLGTGPASGVTVTDTFPAPLACSWTCTGQGGGTCAASGTGNIADNTVNLPAGASVSYTAVCDLNNVQGASLVNTATVAYANDPVTGNNSATDTNTITPAGTVVFSNGFE